MTSRLAIPLLLLVLLSLACGSGSAVTDRESGTNALPQVATSAPRQGESATPSTVPTAAPSLTAPPAAQIAAEIVQINHFEDSIGALHFIGVVENTGTVEIGFVKPVVTLYDANHQVVGTQFTFTHLDVLQPGERSPFDLIFLESASSWTEFEAVVQAQQASLVHPYRDLEIASSSGGVPAFGDYQIQGEVRNTGSLDARFVKVIATLYDASGQLVGVAFTFTTLDIVPAGATSPFEITVLGVAGPVEDYELAVQGNPG